jgi:hypothetical protein
MAAKAGRRRFLTVAGLLAYGPVGSFHQSDAQGSGQTRPHAKLGGEGGNQDQGGEGQPCAHQQSAANVNVRAGSNRLRSAAHNMPRECEYEGKNHKTLVDLYG